MRIQTTLTQDAIRPDLQRMLDATTREDSKALKIAVRKALAPMLRALRAGCPVKTGALQRDIKIRGLRGAVGAMVGPSTSRTNPKAQGHVARFLEYGYMRRNKRTGTVSHIPAHPFLRPAWDATESQVLDKLEGYVAEAVEGRQ